MFHILICLICFLPVAAMAASTGVTLTGASFKSAAAQQQGACTDGVDCLCDTISTASTLLYCEDFERPGFYDASETYNWASKEFPTSYNCYRGQNAPWVDDYGGSGASSYWVASVIAFKAE